MSALEAAVRVVVDLLASGDFSTVEGITRGRRLTAAQMASAIDAYGGNVLPTPENWWASVEVTPIDAGDAAAFHVAAPLWTREEGRSDLTAEIRLTESAPHEYDTEVLGIHVL